MFFVSINIQNCSDPQQELQDGFLELKENNESNLSKARPFTCHTFTISNSTLGFSTKVYYCCAGETLCGTPVLTGCVCSFVSESTYNELTNMNREPQYVNKIHVNELINNFNKDSITITHSSSIIVDDDEYSVFCKDYKVDKNGYITLELSKK